MSAELLQRCPLFRGFTPVGRDIIASIARMVVVPSGQFLFVEGAPSEALYVLIEGRLEIRAKDADGIDVPLGVVEPYESLAEACLLTEQVPAHLVSAFATVDCRVLAVSRDDFRALTATKPQACTKLLLAVAATLAARVADSRSAFRHLLARTTAG